MERSQIMSLVKSQDTTPERMLRKALWHEGLRGWRVGCRKIFGAPDIAFTRWKLAIFVDGCFWHACPICYRRPKTNTEYWDTKIERNIQRDAKVNKILRDSGWKVLRFWEHEIKSDLAKCVSRTIDAYSVAFHG